MKLRHAIALVLAACAASTAASEFPAKQIRIIVHFTPGTSTDVLARLIAAKMSEFDKVVATLTEAGAEVEAIAAR